MKKLLISLSAILIILVIAFFIFIYPKMIIVSGVAAKDMCSCVFVGGIDEKKAINEDINYGILSLASVDVDYENKSVTATVFGLKPKTAYYQGSTGCALVNKMEPKDAYRYPKEWDIQKYDSLENWYSYIDTLEYLSGKQHDNLDKVVNDAFLEADPEKHLKNTRAVVVLYKGQLVAEQYAPGFDKNSRMLGWSMTKGLTATMFSMLEQEGKVSRNDITQIPEWQNDDRKNITWKQLLHMNSGLRWEEKYDDVSDAVKMLFNSDAIGDYAIQMPLEYQPDTHWVYSSGTSNIIATTMRRYFNSTEEYIRYPYDHLFYKIGAYSMIIETDATGRFVGSSYSWATARDWARLGQLYIQKGNWAGEQILSKDWVQFVQQPAPNSNELYGGHFWLNKNGVQMPDVPYDLYSFNGYQGQKVFIIPSKELVIVRLGLAYNENDFDFNSWVNGIIEAVETK